MEPLRVRGRVYGSLSRSCPRLLDYAGLILDLITSQRNHVLDIRHVLPQCLVCFRAQGSGGGVVS